MIIEIEVPLPGKHQEEKRKTRDSRGEEEITDIESWCRGLNDSVAASTKEIETDLEVSRMNSRLAHMIEAKNALLARWKRQRLNRRLCKKIAELNLAIEEHCKELCHQQWHELCNTVAGQMQKGMAWNILRHLLEESKTKSHQRDRLAMLLHKATTDQGEDAIKKRLIAKYLPHANTISIEEVRTALHDLNSKSAPGPDRITNSARRNLDDRSIQALAGYYNQCWKTGKLPSQWKKAKMVLIPKPGKPPDPDNLRPISLTSCVGKVLEHVVHNRWQKYLEETDAFPHMIIGFRQSLSTQDATLQIKPDD
ncbi:uncharacterized protein LOC144155674 [Haemaphysalis longicornis]